MVSITYGHGYLTDCDDTTDWTETENNLNAELTCDYGDVFRITGAGTSLDDDYAYYEYDITNISSDIYTKYLVRYKTSESSNGLGARVKLIFSSGSQWILGEAAPAFSTSWATVSGEITAGKTITKVQLWADDDPDTWKTDTDYVYFDFVLLHKDTFTLPHVAGSMDLDPLPRYVQIGIPGRVSDVTQNLGSECATININGLDLDQGTWKRDGDTINGEVFLDIAHNSTSEPWQWLDTGSHQFKVTTHPHFYWRDNKRLLDILFREYSLSDKSNETYAERFGI